MSPPRRSTPPRAAPPRAALALGALGALALVTAVLALGRGAMPIPPGRVLAALVHAGDVDPAAGATVGTAAGAAATDAIVIRTIRLPRVLTGALVGAALAVSGAALQGLFRNPLADPGLIGVSAGAALGAMCVIVLGARFGGALGESWAARCPRPPSSAGSPRRGSCTASRRWTRAPRRRRCCSRASRWRRRRPRAPAS